MKKSRHDADPDRLHADGDLPPSRRVRVMSYIIKIKLHEMNQHFPPVINNQLISQSVITGKIQHIHKLVH